MSVAWLAVLVTGRILFSSLANVLQKKMVERTGNAPVVVTSSLCVVSLLVSAGLFFTPWQELSWQFWLACIVAATLDVPGNVLLVGSLGKSDLSLIGPLNSLKPVVGMLLGIIILQEMPSLSGLFGIAILAAGTWALAATSEGKSTRAKLAWLWSPAARWRFGALFFTSAAAICIKPAVQIAGPWPTFAVWSWCCTLLALLWIGLTYGRSSLGQIIHPSNWSLPLLGLGFFFCGLQGLSIWLFQVMPVSYALALFQLGSVVNVYFGCRFFGETAGWQRLIVSMFMLLGATLIILG